MAIKQPRSKGRPPGDPADIKEERIAIRVHEDLIFELNVLARMEGITRSQLIERLLIKLVNDSQPRTVVDKVGRYIDDKPPAVEANTPRAVEWMRAHAGHAAPRASADRPRKKR